MRFANLLLFLKALRKVVQFTNEEHCLRQLQQKGNELSSISDVLHIRKGKDNKLSLQITSPYKPEG